MEQLNFKGPPFYKKMALLYQSLSHQDHDFKCHVFVFEPRLFSFLVSFKKRMEKLSELSTI